MMIPVLSRKSLVRTLGATLAVVIMIGCAASAVRAEDDDDDALPDVKFFRSLMKGLGLSRGEDGINYRERSPLVVPPSRDLPTPVAGPIVEKNPAWPKDPDITKRKLAKSNRTGSVSNGNAAMDENMRPLRPDELRPKASPNANARVSANPADNRVINYSDPMKPSELGYKGGLFSSLFGTSKEGTYATFTGEQPRTSLIEPPAGYRTPSPAQPYGAGKSQWEVEQRDRLLMAR